MIGKDAPVAEAPQGPSDRPELPSGSEPGPGPRPRRRWRRWWAWPLLVPLQVLIPVLLVLVWVLGTESGLRSALALAEDLAPGVVQVERLQGRIAGDLHLEGLRLRLPDLEVDAGSIDLRWRPLTALTGTLRIQELAGRDLRILTAPSPAEPEPVTLPELVLPLGIEVERGLVERLSIGELPASGGGEAGTPGGPAPPFVIDRIALAAALIEGRLELRELALDLPEPSLRAQAQGQAELKGDYPLGLALDWTLTLPAATEVDQGQAATPTDAPAPAPATPEQAGASLAGTGKVSGDLSRLRLETAIGGAVDLTLTGEVMQALERPAWDARLELRQVDLPAFAPGLPQVDLHGTLATSGNLDQAKVTGRLEGEAQGLPEFGHLVADLDLIWAEQTLRIGALKLREDASGADLDVGGELVLGQDPGRFDLRASWERLRWPLVGEVLAETRTGRLTASGTFDAYAYSLAAEVAGRDLPGAALDLKGEGSRKGARVQALQVDTLGGRIDASGDLTWDPEPRWDLKVAAKQLDPGRLVPDLASRVSFEAESAGTLDGYDLRLVGETGGPALPEARIALAATGDRKSAKVETLRLDTLGGRIEVQGGGTWDTEPSWDANLVAEGLDPSQHWPDWPGKLAGKVATSGRMTPSGPDLGVQLEGIGGELRGYPVAASGRVRVAGQTVNIEELIASSGPTKARVGGRLGMAAGERLDLAFALESPDLKTLLPEAEGRIQAEGTLGGTALSPEVKAKLAAKGVQVAGQGIEALEGNLDLGLGPQGRFDIRLTGKGLAAGGLVWQALEVRGDGSMADHRLSADLKGEVLSARLKATGALKPDQTYAGTLAEFELISKGHGHWRLQGPAPITYAQPRIGVGPLCLRDGQGRDGAGGSGGCVRFEQTGAGKWTADLDLDRLALGRLGPFLPSNMVAEGAASLKGRFAADGPVLKGNAALAVPKGSLRVKLGRRTEVLDFSSARLGLDADAKGLAARLSLPLAGIGSADADLRLAGWRLDNPARPDQPLSGRVRAQVADLKRIASPVPDLTKVTGTIDLDLGLSGSLARPGVKGGARLFGGGFDVPLLGLAVRDLGLTADAVAPDHVVYKGGLDLGGGRLTVSGESQLIAGAPGPAGWQTQVRINGERLKVASSKEYFALVSPDIGLRVGASGLDVSGELRVPEARIRPRAIPPGTVSPSADVTLEKGGAKRAEPFPIAADVRLMLGDNVSIDAFGLRGLLRGDLRVIKAPGRGPVGDGQISVVDGTYRLSGTLGLMAAVGKPLTVEQGILVFAKTPLDNPGLVLTAQREGGDVTAGVRVLGTLKKPKLAFFSESDPDMSPSEITSYLITGVPPRRDSTADARAVAVGTYITPKLYMEYESNLGDAADKVKLRYELNNRIELQTETGSGQGADIFYKFEN